MTFSEHVLQFHHNLSPDWKLPPDIDLLFPYNNPETLSAMDAFYRKYYTDTKKRVFIFGINPGRHGAGITGISFTDPIRLENVCGISNPFHKRPELSSDFVYRFIDAYGGANAFYSLFYITSVCPLGFTKDGKNINYYDDKGLQNAVADHIVSNINTQLQFGGYEELALCLGQGKNHKYLQQINAENQWFDRIIPLPHPRWVMQYRRKRMEEFISEYISQLQLAKSIVQR